MQGFDYQRFYDRLSPLYAAGMRLIPVWSAYVREVLPWLPTEGDVLEIGHGPGLLLEELARRDSLAAGLDLSWRMIHRAQRRLRRVGLPACLSQGDAVALPYLSGTFQGVVMTFALGAIPDGLTAMREVARVLCPGGVVALVEAGIPSDRPIMAVLLAKLWGLFGDLMRDEAAVMRQAGLEVVARRDFGAFRSIRLVVGRKP